MEVNLIKENEDGSADFTFECTAEETKMLLTYAIRRAIEEAVKQGMEWIPPKEEGQ
jgi:hypothetical protein